MRIAVGSDHAGYDLKVALAGHLAGAGHQVDDLGTGNATDSVDYPVFGAAVGQAVADGRADLGVCVCGTGIGIGIAANKVPGVRAALAYDVTTASLARQHNHANVVCFGGRTTGEATATDALDAFLAATPQHGRHDRRVEELGDLERAAVGAPATAAVGAPATAAVGAPATAAVTAPGPGSPARPDPVTAGGSR